MKINTENHEELSEELAKVNADDVEYTFKSGGDLNYIGLQLKDHLSQWFTFDEMENINGISISGDGVPNNIVVWHMGPEGAVYITHIEKSKRENGPKKTMIRFTSDQKSVIAKKAIESAQTL
jgi:hypothetical protein